MRPLTILGDLDGVFVDWTKRFKGDLAANYPHLEFDELREFTTPAHLSLEHQTAINRTKYAGGFYADMEPIEGAIEGYRRLVEQGHEVFFCSSPEIYNPTCASDKYDWVRHYLGDPAAKRVILTRDKTLVRGDILIDDRPDVDGAMKPTWQHVLFAQPYNDDAPLNGRIRMDGWADLDRVLAEYPSVRGRFAQGGYVTQPGSYADKMGLADLAAINRGDYPSGMIGGQFA